MIWAGVMFHHGGHIPTPNIDALAKNGLELNRFYASPVCSPTRASLLTGLHIFNHGIIRPLANPTAEQYGRFKNNASVFKESRLSNSPLR